MHLVTLIYFCILYSYVLANWENSYKELEKYRLTQTAHKWPRKSGVLPGGRESLKGFKVTNDGNEELDVKQYLAEVAAGSNAEFLGSNVHVMEPPNYKDLSRRFIAVYPYESKIQPKENDADEILQYIQSPKKAKKAKNREIIPVRAPPEVVLAVMEKAKKIAESNPKPSEPTEEVIRQYMLRSGDYWDDVVKEEIDPDGLSLRTKIHDNQSSGKSDEGLFEGPEPVSAKLRPGTKLYSLIAEIVKKAPRLVYIINNK